MSRNFVDWNNQPQLICKSGKTQTAIHNIVARKTLKSVARAEIHVGNLPGVKDLFVHLLYMEDYEETARRLMLTKDTKDHIRELLEAVHEFCVEGERIVCKIVEAFLTVCSECGDFLDGIEHKEIQKIVGRCRLLAKKRDEILLLTQDTDADPPAPLQKPGDWTVVSRNEGSFVIRIKSKDPVLVFVKGRKFALSTATILGETKEGLMGFEELLRTLNLSLENLQYT